ncbi:MAG TPA: DUF2948 family protein [Xanthobacteraceae bacterium]|jgi:hypothetical protein|nr:DUF2948 family protein [Xanthobacteraceae bacterium]
MDSCTDELKLVALDKDDMDVVSAHLQDARVKVGDIFWQPDNHRFVMAVHRFDWMSAVDGNTQNGNYRRCRTALRFERVNACKCRNLDQTSKNTLLNLLAVEFAQSDAPAGVVSLIFSGGGVIRLDVECLEAELADLGEVSAVAVCPDHFTAGRATA